jgi:hypothetical protein
MAVALWIFGGKAEFDPGIGYEIKEGIIHAFPILILATQVLIQNTDGIIDLIVADILRSVIMDDVEDDRDDVVRFIPIGTRPFEISGESFKLLLSGPHLLNELGIIVMQLPKQLLIIMQTWNDYILLGMYSEHHGQ